MCKRTIKLIPAMILFIFAVAIYAAHLRALPVTASLQSVTGDVQIMLPGGSWQPGTVNMSLPSGTQIKTGAKSSAVVKWSSSNTLKINPFTNFTIKDIDIDPRTKTVTSNLDLVTGKVKAKAEKLHNPSSEFSISTPTAVAGVRGTEFDMENTPENTTSVTTRTGSVEVTSQGQSVMAVPGTQVVVQPNQPPAPPVPVSNEDMNACEVDEDCMSHKCVDGQCEGEESAMQSGGCRALAATCSAAKDCCSGNCADGVCAEKTADQTVAACIPNGSACKAGDECCSKNCGVGGVCVAPPAASGSETAASAAAAGTSDEEDEIECFVELSKPEDGGSYPFTKGTVAVSGLTIPGAACVIGGASVTAGANGAFTSEFTLESAGATTISVACANSDGTCKAETKIAIDAVAPPKLEISNPNEGFMQCPWVPISGSTDPGTNVYVNGASIKGNPKATIGADGSFSLDGFYQQDCTKPIEFVANDQFGQTTRLVINSGATANATAMGVNIQSVDVLLVPSGVWVNGQTSVQAVATAKSSTAFSGALTVTFTDGAGAFLGSRTLMPIAGATAARLEDGSSAARASGQSESSSRVSNAYYAQARMTIFSGPANPLTVRARIGEISAPAENSIVLRGIVCSTTTMVPGDGIDNDCDGRIDEDPVDGLDNDGDGRIDEDSPAIGAKCDSRLSQAYCDTLTNEKAAQIGMKCDNRIDDDRDGRVDEESPDGIDNDGDGRIDEDLKCVCDPTDQYADCDFDGLRNGLDCNANKWESAPIRRDSALCAVSCNAQAMPDGDCDGDGLLNAQEMALGTDPYKKDTDGDSYTDLQEVQAGTDPRKAEDNPGTRTYQTVTPTAAVCVGGQIKTPEGNCICPSGTMWSSATQSCMVASFAQCSANQYFDTAVGGCVSSCTGGQVADSTIGRCYCATGFLGTEGYCLPGCPTGMVGDPATRVCVCQPGLYYDMSVNGCSATCSGGQVIDPIMNQCVCPTGTSLNPSTRTCVANVSATICPTGTAGAGCDFAIASRDCDADGIQNVDDANPCVNETGVVVTESGTFQRLCPEGTDAVGCDLMTNPDCDLDGAPNTSDQCPCRAGTAATSYCPTVAVTCPAGQYLDQFYGTCHTTCPAPKIGDPQNMRCVCGPGTALDINTGQCVSSCPVGMVMGTNGECVCGPNAPLMDQFTAACSVNCSGGQVTTPETPGMCVCPQGYGPDFATKQCVMNCPSGMIAGANGCVCGPSAPYMDPFTYGCQISCTGGSVPANDPQAPGMCMCPEGTYPDYASGQCMSICPAGMVYSNGNCGCGGSTPFMDTFVEGCVASCTGGSAANDPQAPGMCMCPEGTYPDQVAGQCMSICPAGMVFSEGSCVCGGSTPFMDPFVEGCVASCTGGSAANDPEMPGMCMCPEGTYPDYASGQCMSICPDGMVFSEGNCVCGGDTPFMDPFVDGCSASCTGGTVEDLMMPGFCVCPQGTNPDFGLMECVSVFDPCDIYGDPGICEDDSNCFWDVSKSRCNFDGGMCGSYDMSVCMSNSETCYWNPSEMVCLENSGQVYCGGHTYEECDMDPACQWNMDYCGEAQGEISCYEILNDVDCENTMGCMWDVDQCVMDMGGACSQYVNSGICDQTPGCSWDYDFGACEEVIDDCATHLDSSSCYEDMSCGWNSYDGTCYSLDGDCTDIHLNESDCVADADERCEWNIMSTTCVFKMSAICPTYTEMNMCDMQQGCIWDEVEQACVNDIAPPECFTIFNQMDCDNTFGCMWDGMNTQCVQDFGDVCSLYENSTDCNNDAYCYYDGMSGCEMLENGGNCGFFGSDQSLCELHSAYCQWNTYGDGYCEAFDPGPGCYNYSGELDCDAAPGCFWFAGETACLEIIPGECWNYSTQMQCGKDYLCMWDVDQCVVAGPDCALISNDVDCGNTMGCMWDIDHCVIDMGGPECWNVNNQNDCGQTMGCYWNGYQCIEDTGSCYDYYDETQCENNANCYWNGYSCIDDLGCESYNVNDCFYEGCEWNNYMGQCFENGTGCSAFNGDEWSCAYQFDCYWDTGNQECVEQCGVGYHWNGYMCDENTGGCSDYSVDYNCNSAAGCFWDGYGSNQCLELNNNEQCQLLQYEYQCNQNATYCEWYGSGGFSGNCGPIAVDCASYEEFGGPEACNGSSLECEWNFNNYTCVPEGTAGCGAFADDSSICEAQTGVCEWNFNDGNCVNYGTAGCAGYGWDESAECDNQPYCVWDSYYGRCNTQWDLLCGQYGDPATCNMDYGCAWETGDPGSCVEMTNDSYCSSFSDDASCEAHSNYCNWYSASNVCAQAYYQCDYYSSSGPNTCNSDPDCEWNYGYEFCANQGDAGCFKYGPSDVVACDEDALCYWNGYSCTSDTGSCYDYYDETPCENNANCYWNGYSCTEDLGCESYNANDCYYEGCEWNDYMGQCFENGTGCSAFNGDEWSCAYQFDCYWDSGNQECVEQCGAGYHWNGYMCDENTGGCSDYSVDYNCNSAAGCFWDGYGSNQCLELNHSGQCQLLQYEYQCNQNATYCEWYGSGGYSGNCGPIAVDCASYEEFGGPDACNVSTLGCEWNFNNYTCVPEGTAGCGAFADDSSICEAQTGVCEWNFNDGNCVGYGTAGCAGYGYDESAECDNEPYCVWDSYYGRCDTQWDLLCGQYGEPTTCNMDFGCVWETGDPGSCVIMTNDSYCSTFEDDASCEAHSNYCNWYSASNVCAEAYYQCDYYSSTDPATCNSDPDCEWFYGEEFCANLGDAGCNKYGPTDAVACDSNPMCAWDGYMCEEDMEVSCSQHWNMNNCQWDGCFWYGDHCGANPCSNQNDPYTCNESPYCYWWYDFCELGEGSGDPCSSLSESYCLDYGGGGVCNWQTGDMSYCVPAGMFACDEIIDEYECNSNPNCAYGEGCMNFIPQMCDLFESDESACAAHGCYWNMGLQMCMEEEPGLQCSGYSTLETCNADMECVYMESNCYALDTEVNCGLFIDDMQCMTHGQYCKWYMGLEVCGGKSEGCGIYESNNTACEIDLDCDWTGTACVEAGGATACGEHTTLEACNIDSACYWDDTVCVDFTGYANCGPLAEETYCEAHNADCKWYAGLNTCDWITYGCGYYEFAEPSQCGMDDDCYYNYNADECVAVGTAGCGAYGETPSSCNMQTGTCEWNYSTELCVEFGTAGCGKHQNDSMCIGDMSCEWETDHCVEKVQTGCEIYDMSNTCNVNPECVWTGSTCAEMSSASQCSMFTIENDCGYHGTFCNWYSGLNMCGDISLGCGFYGYGESACNSDPDCEYNHNIPECVGVGTAGCGAFGSSSSICNAEAACIWTGSDCDDFTDVYQCSVFTIQSDCVVHSSLCGWYAGVSLCDDASIGCSYYGSNGTACNMDMNCMMADSTDCYMYASSQSVCETNIECAFSYSGGSACDGSAAPCVNYMDESACNAVDGCSWATGCGGTPTNACSFYTEQAACSVDSGCSWTGICGAETLLCTEN